MFRLVLPVVIVACSAVCVAQDARLHVDVVRCRMGFCVPEKWDGNAVYVARNDDNSQCVVRE